ncbi:MAG: DUF3857 domain-containing protein [Planctomycetota bacterium]
MGLVAAWFVGDAWGLVLAQGHESARDAGRACGGIFIPLLLLAGVLKCNAIAKREAVSKACVWSLGVFLLSWAMALIGNYVGDQMYPGGAARAVKIIGSALLILGLLTTVVLAIVGLATYRYPQDPPNERGRGQAIWSLILSACVGGLFTFGVVRALDRNQSGIDSDQVTQVTRGETLRFVDLNFEVEAPGRPWVSIDPAAVNPDARVVLRKRKPDIFWIVTPEVTGIESGLSLDLLVELVKANLQDVATRIRVENERDVRLDDQPARQFTVDARVNGLDLFYDFRVMTHRGFAYQLITYGEKKDRSTVRREADTMAASFRMIDPNRAGQSIDAGEAIAELSRPEFGFSLKLDDSRWTAWPDVANDFEEAAAGAILDGMSYLTITPVPLMDGVELSDAVVIDGLLRNRDLSLQRSTGRRSDHPGATGFVFDSFSDSLTNDVPAKYHIRVARNKNWAYFILGWTITQSEDGLQRLVDAAAAIEFDPNARPMIDEPRRDIVANAINDFGLAAFDRDEFAAALPAFKSALQVRPTYEVYAKNVVEAYNRLGQYQQAVESAEQHLAKFPDHASVRAAYALNLRWLDREQEASEVYESLFETGYDEDWSIDDYLDGLQYMEQYTRALDWLDAYESRKRGQHSDRDFRRAGLLSLAGRHDEAIALYEQKMGQLMTAEAARPGLLRALIDADRSPEAIRRADDMLHEGHRSAEIVFERGRAELELKWYAEADRSFREANELSGSDAYRGYSDYTAELLGRGNNDLIRTPIEAVAWPGHVQAASDSRESKPWTPPPGYDATYLRSVEGIDVAEDGTQRKTLWRTIRIEDRAALEAFSTLEFRFDPAHESLFVNEVTVSDGQGPPIAAGNLDQYFVTDASSGSIHNTTKIATVPVPGLSVGATLRYHVTWQDRNKIDDVSFERWHLVKSRPSRYELLFMTGQVGGVDAITYGPIEALHDEPDLKLWIADEPPIHDWEPYQPKWTAMYPTLAVGPAERTWADVGREYLGRLEPTLSRSDEVGKIANEIFVEATTPQDVITAANRYVQDRLTYEAIAFGVRGQIPHRVDDVVRQRFGDCKDHTLLLWHLLRERNIDAHLALVNTDETVVPELPSLGQFDHMVLYIPSEGDIPAYVLDATNDDHPPTHGPPHGLGGRALLVLDPAGPALVTAPPYDRPMSLQSQRRVMLQPDGELRIEQRLVFDGFIKQGMRGFLVGLAEQERPRRFESIMREHVPVQLDHLHVSDLSDLEAPLTIEIAYRMPDAFSRDGDAWVGRLPGVWEHDYLEPTRVLNRKQPMQIRHDTVVSSEIEFIAPPGYRMASAWLPVSGDNAHTSWRFAPIETTDENRTEVTIEIARKSGEHPASAYAEFESTMRQALRPLSRPIRVVPIDSP